MSVRIPTLLLALTLAAARLAAQVPGFEGLAGGPAAPGASAPEAPRPALPLRPGDGFVLGFNQAWLKQHYGSQWTGNWDEVEARRMLRFTRELGGRVLRMWIFEGEDPEGLTYQGRTTPGRQGSHTGAGPDGILPAKLEHLERFLEMAEEEGVAVYLTLFDAVIHSFASRADSKDFWWNLLHDKYGVGTAFREHALRPVLEVVRRHQKAVYGIDLMNEMNALVHHHWFRDWAAAVEFVRTWRAAIREVVPVPVTASLGNWYQGILDWGYGESDLLARRLPPDAVDFYDFHSYGDGGVRWGKRVERLVREVEIPVVLGEFGEHRIFQSKSEIDEPKQRAVTVRYLWHSRGIGLAGAFAWRLDGTLGEVKDDDFLSFRKPGGWRPAADAFRDFAAGLPPPSRAP